MAANRKLQSEVQQVLKKIDEGVELFDEIMGKVYAADSQALKEKFENELKKEIKKLQRLRDQVKGWISSNEIKEKNPLMEARRVIESKMESFKICERDTKTKAYSKEGLARDSKLDPREQQKEDTRSWLNDALDKLQDLNTLVDGEKEKLGGASGNKRGKNKEALDRLDNRMQKHRWHIGKIELMLRLLENDEIEPTTLDGVKDSVEYYLETAIEDDGALGVESEFDIYEDLELDSFGNFDVVVEKEKDEKEKEKEKEPVKDAGKEKEKEKEKVADKDKGKKEKDKVEKKSDKEPEVVSPRPGVSTTAPAVTPPSTLPATVRTVKSSSLAPAVSPAVSLPHSASSQSTPTATTPTTPAVPVQTMAAALAASLGVKSVSTVAAGGSAAPAVTPASAPVASAPAPAATTAPISVAPSAAPTAPAAPVVPPAPVPVSTPAPAAPVAAAPVSVATAPAPAAPTPAIVPPAPVQIPTPTPPLLAPSALGASSGLLSSITPPPPSLSQSLPTPTPSPAPLAGLGLTNVSSSSSLSQLLLGPQASSTPSTPLGATPQSQLSPELMAIYGQLKQSHQFSTEADVPAYVPRNFYSSGHASFPTTPTVWGAESGNMFDKLPLDTLLFAFYYQQNTPQQVMAARRLKKSSWRFHKKFATWFQRHSEPKMATVDSEEGAFNYFDYDIWTQRVKQDFRFEYAFLEDEL